MHDLFITGEPGTNSEASTFLRIKWNQDFINAFNASKYALFNDDGEYILDENGN